MRRLVAGRSERLLLGLVAGWVSTSSAARADDPPPVLPPVVEAPVAVPEASEPRPAPAVTPTPPPGNTAVLAIPGLTTPRPGRRPTTPAPRAVAPLPRPIDPDSLPPLVGPSDTPPASGIHVLPPEPIEEPIGRSQTPATSDPRQPRRERAAEKKKAGARPTLPESELDPPSRRAPGFFGRLFPPMGGLIGGPVPADEGIRVEPRTDPAADAALKRRIETQIDQNLGARLRSYDVRVVGRTVTIQARTARFWQRRAVRSALQSLPALAGTRPTIFVDE